MSAPSADAADRLAAAATTDGGVVAWYAPGFSDRLGDRLLLFDSSGAEPLELLRIAQRLTSDPGFEPALRARVEQLEPFRHPAFARVRGVSVLSEPVPQLALVSEHIPGERLTQILRAARRAGVRPDPGTALWLIRQLLPAIAALHQAGAGIAHGTLSPDRIIVTPTGDLVVTEYVFASALDQLPASGDELWRTLGVASRGRPGRRLDERNDVEQVGLLALAVLLGRPLGPHEYPVAVGDLLAEACDVGRWSFAAPLRAWLGQALAVGDAPRFGSARQALATLETALPRITGTWTPRLLPQNLEAPADPPPGGQPTNPADAPPMRAPAATPPPGTARGPSPQPARRGYVRPPDPRPARAPAARTRTRRGDVPAGDQAALIRRLRRRNAALTGLAAVEAVCLALLLHGGQGRAHETGSDATADAPVLAAGAASVGPQAAAAARPRDDGARGPEASADTGWIAVTAPIELEVHANGRLLGRGHRTRFSLLPGEYDVTLVNQARRIRIAQRIRVESGRVVALRPQVEP